MTSDIRLRYREAFRSHYGAAFQHWFEGLATTLHGADCFLPIRVTRGDGGLDGLVVREGRVYQLYAPATLGADSATANKVRADFLRAKETLGESLRAWTFVHNSPDGKVGHLTAAAAQELQASNVHIAIDILGIDALWDRLNSLPVETLATLFDAAMPDDNTESQVRVLLKRVDDSNDQGKRQEAMDLLTEGLAIAAVGDHPELQAEILIALCLMSSERDGLGDRAHYFAQLRPLAHEIADPKLLVLYHRAHAAYLLDSRAYDLAEAAYRAAIDVATAPDNAGECASYLCITRTDLAHLLCTTKRRDEATECVQLAEDYARRNADSHGGELLEAALHAGLHWAAIGSSEESAVARIAELEASASTGRRASRVAGSLVNVANNLSHLKCHRAALAAGEAALRLAARMPMADREAFLPGVLYTIATVHFAAGQLEEARQRAQALVNTADSDKTGAIRFAATQLVSVISRQIGDVATAVDRAEIAVELARELDSTMLAKLNLSESLADRGDTHRALTEAQEAFQLASGRIDIPVALRAEVLTRIAWWAADLGQLDAARDAIERLSELEREDPSLAELRERCSKRVEGTTEIRRRILDISLAGKGAVTIQAALQKAGEFRKFIAADAIDPPSTVSVQVNTLREANALTIAPVLKWWEDTAGDPNAAALDYDYWGRGCFAQILRNLQAFPHSLNVAVEVRSLEDVQRSLRLWAPYAEFVLLLWKGPTESGKFLHLVDGEWFGPWGAGYMLALGTKLEAQSGRSRFPAIGYASWLPADIAQWLATVGRPYLASGRALVVPASGVGCVSPGHGVIEQLLTEVANCIPAMRQARGGDMEIGLLPYSSDVPLDILFDFIQEHESELLEMRELMLSKTAHVGRNGLQASPRALELEIADSLRRLRIANATLARRRNLSPPVAEDTRVGVSPLGPTSAPRLAPHDQAFSPLLRLESMGYGWGIRASLQGPASSRYQPADGEAIGAWLAPPEPGVSILAAKAADEE